MSHLEALGPCKIPDPNNNRRLKSGHHVGEGVAAGVVDDLALRRGQSVFYVSVVPGNEREQQRTATTKKSAAGERGKAKQHLSLKKAADLAGRESGC